MQTGNFRIVFFVNFIELPFIWQGFDGISNFERASKLANLLAKFDLGKATSEDAILYIKSILRLLYALLAQWIEQLPSKQ